MKTIFINIQLDEVKLSELEKLEDGLRQLLKGFPRQRIDFNISETLGTPLPPVNQTEG